MADVMDGAQVQRARLRPAAREAGTPDRADGMDPGIAKLVVQKRERRVGRNPATGAAVEIPARQVVKARIAKRSTTRSKRGRRDAPRLHHQGAGLGAERALGIAGALLIDLCHLLGEPTPAGADPCGDYLLLRAGRASAASARPIGRVGSADVWRHHQFAREYKRGARTSTRSLTESGVVAGQPALPDRL